MALGKKLLLNLSVLHLNKEKCDALRNLRPLESAVVDGRIECRRDDGSQAIFSTVWAQREFLLSSSRGRDVLASASSYDRSGNKMRRALFWSFSILSDKYDGMQVLQTGQQ